MADEQHTRRADLGATEPHAAASRAGASSRGDWDRLHFEYARQNALRVAALAWGPAPTNYNDFQMFENRMARKHGSWAKAHASIEDGAEFRELFARVDEMTEADGQKYHDPATRAAIALVTTPAPDLTALLTTLDVIRDYELDNCSWMPRGVMYLIQEDADRVTDGHAEAGT